MHFGLVRCCFLVEFGIGAFLVQDQGLKALDHVFSLSIPKGAEGLDAALQ